MSIVDGRGKQIVFEVYGEPKGKGRPRFFRRGNFVGTYTPDSTRMAERSILEQAMEHKPKEPLKGPLFISLMFYMPIPKSTPKSLRAKLEATPMPHFKKPDLDNLIKSVLDPLNTIFWVDDSQIYAIESHKWYGKVPMTRVIIEEIIIDGK